MTNLIKTTHLLLAALVMSTSCIYDAPGDSFYRTLWASSESPLDNIPIDDFTLDFLCGQAVCVKSSPNSATSYGTYEPDKLTATFSNLTLYIGNQTITFIDAHRHNDTLTLNWKLQNSPETHTTTLHRLSSYPK